MQQVNKQKMIEKQSAREHIFIYKNECQARWDPAEAS